ncbi:TIR domain-containing protein [Saccharothrix sp. S26]|uniref:TIR domain-containing protein n=1 Tax=Saccharothrix sp. S26 TaxID=2907215 RepID=UPI001F33FF87|nr:TIR domain-containing protein [Saccharothrix sp. S26]MCE6997301.1 TIR domain-containing protein [Saccharothrix sp. S26]
MTHVFISYSRAQQAYAQELARYLRVEHDIPTWIDDELITGDRWERVIRTKIDECAALVVVMTPDAEASDWVDLEITRARDRGKPIVPVLLDGTVFFRLGNLQYEDVRDRSMPGDRFLRALRKATTTESSPDAHADSSAPAPKDHGSPSTRKAVRWAGAVVTLVGAVIVVLANLPAGSGDTGLKPSSNTSSPTTTAERVGAVTTPSASCAIEDIQVVQDAYAYPNIALPSNCAPPASLGIRDLTPGNGPQVATGATVLVHYALLTWSDRKARDSSFAINQPFEVQNVGNAQVIDGWNEGLIGAKEGGRRLLVVPPDKGYPSGQGDIPPNETLVFVIDVLDVS